MHYLKTGLSSKDGFVVALRSAFQQAGVPLEEAPAGLALSEEHLVRMDLQPDKTMVAVSLTVGEPPRRHEFLEENPDILEIAVRDALIRGLKKRT